MLTLKRLWCRVFGHKPALWLDLCLNTGKCEQHRFCQRCNSRLPRP